MGRVLMGVTSDNGKSLIIQLNIKSETTTVDEIFNSTKDVFSGLGYKMKKIFYSCNNKVYSPNLNRFCSQWDSIKEQIKSLSIQSDYNKSDFEPNVELDIELNFRYVQQRKIIKYSIILNNDYDNLKNFDCYKCIINSLSKNDNLIMSGYSYYLDNYYGAVSFSHGILRKRNMPNELKTLAAFYHNSDVNYTTIGIYNCFSCLDSSEIGLLKFIFGEDNVITSNSITFCYNRFIELTSIQDYLKSKNYMEICKTLSSKFKCDMLILE